MMKKSHITILNRSMGCSGFTLIEMAVVMVIAGVIISIMATVLPSLLQAGKIKKSRAILEKINYATQGFVSATGRLPCPDISGDGKEDRNDGGTAGNPVDDTCAAYVGDLPFLTLGLSSGTDVWGYMIKYGVYEDLIKTTVSTGSNPLCSSIDTIIQYYDLQHQGNPTDTSKLHINDAAGSNTRNIAYVLVSGGMKDLDQDGSDGFFDGFNEGSDLRFDSTDRIAFHGDPLSSRYDDLMQTASLTYLNGIAGCAVMANDTVDNIGNITGENAYPNGCTNGIDDDGDSLFDCDDQDCFGVAGCPAGGSNLVITTGAIPSGTVGSVYGVTFQASGGLTPYEWTLTDNGGFTDFYLHTYTGQLTGSLTQCSGSYNISLQVEDATLPSDGGPKTASKSFSIQVTSALSISRTSGSGTSITWSLAGQEETFRSNGGYVGSINWQLQPGGATGFTVVSTGSDTAAIRKTGTSTPGTYTFTLTATDSACPGNTAQIVLIVTVTASGGGSPGDITGIIDSLEFDTNNGREPFIIPISGEVFAITYSGPGNDGWLKTVRIAADGSITDPQIDTLEFDNAYALIAPIIPIAGDVYAIAYRGPGNDGWLKTVQIGSDGQIGNTVIDALEFDTNYAYAPDIVRVAGNYYAIAYRGPGNDGWLKIVEIANDGQITNTIIDSLEFDASNGLDPDIIHIGGEVFAIAYSGPGNDGWLKTVQISNVGTIVNPQIDTLEYDTAYSYRPSVIPVSGDFYAIAYRGPGNDGWLKTAEIQSDGQITGSAISSFEFDPSNGLDPYIINLSGNFFAIAYSGPGTDGWLVTIEISDSGQIVTPVIESLEFDTVYGFHPRMVNVSGDIFAVVYRGPNNDGWLKTIGINP